MRKLFYMPPIPKQTKQHKQKHYVIFANPINPYFINNDRKLSNTEIKIIILGEKK